jgi:hypothetical protein
MSKKPEAGLDVVALRQLVVIPLYTFVHMKHFA